MSRTARLTPAQERERRARVALAGLAAVLVVVCAIQAPRLLHHASAEPAAGTATAPAVSTGAPSLAAAAVAPAPAPHLRRLRDLAWKDPFRQQMQPKADAPKASATQAAKQAAPPEAAATMRTPPAVAESAPPSQAKVVKPLPAKAVAVGKPGVLLLLDGHRLGLLPGDLFPTADPVFRLVSFTKTAARIALVTGTLGDGTSKLQLQVGRRLVLHDATTGTTYALVLVRPTRVVPSAAKAPKA